MIADRALAIAGPSITAGASSFHCRHRCGRGVLPAFLAFKLNARNARRNRAAQPFRTGRGAFCECSLERLVNFWLYRARGPLGKPLLEKSFSICRPSCIECGRALAGLAAAASPAPDRPCRGSPRAAAFCECSLRRVGNFWLCRVCRRARNPLRPKGFSACRDVCARRPARRRRRRRHRPRAASRGGSPQVVPGFAAAAGPALLESPVCQPICRPPHHGWRHPSARRLRRAWKHRPPAPAPRRRCECSHNLSSEQVLGIGRSIQNGV
jgi:hypothetical protein